MYLESIDAVSTMIRQGTATIPELVSGQLERIAVHDSQLNSYSELLTERALTRAERLQHEVERGNIRGPLHGIPIAVKDLFWVQGTPPNAGGIVFRHNQATANAAVVDRLERAGAIIVGKLRMSEAALAAHHPDLPVPRNPWDPEAWIGASSSGNAAATAAGLCFGSIATDTGGSIRFPSAAAGVTGLKPTWGAVNAKNSVEFAASLDHVGPMARSAADCKLIFDVIRDVPAPQQPSALPLRVGVDPKFMAECDDETRAVLDRAQRILEGLGATFIEVNLPDVEGMVDDWTPTCAVEAAVFHEPTFRASRNEYGPQVREFLDQGLALTAVEYERMRRRREQFRGDFTAAMGDVDALLLQVTGIAGPDAKYLDEIGVGEEWRRKIMLATCPINFIGFPALTLPGGQTTSGRPIGFQLVGRSHSEDRLVEVGVRFQEDSDFHLDHPHLSADVHGMKGE